MAYTYNPDNPITPLDRIRLAIGDHDATEGKGIKPDGGHFSDGEINAYLSDCSEWYEAMPPILRTLGNQYAAASRGLANSPNVDERVITIMVNLVRMSAEFREQALDWENYQPRDPSSNAELVSYFADDL